MGFDTIDRQFRPKEPVRLECVKCGSTDNVQRWERCTHYGGGVIERYETDPLCYTCGGLT